MRHDEIIGMCCKVLKGVTLDPEHLAPEVIESVGPGGNFITAPYTKDHLYTEYYRGSTVTDQKDRELEFQIVAGGQTEIIRMIEFQVIRDRLFETDQGG